MYTEEEWNRLIPFTRQGLACFGAMLVHRYQNSLASMLRSLNPSTEYQPVLDFEDQEADAHAAALLEITISEKRATIEHLKGRISQLAPLDLAMERARGLTSADFRFDQEQIIAYKGVIYDLMGKYDNRLLGCGALGFDHVGSIKNLFEDGCDFFASVERHSNDESFRFFVTGERGEKGSVSADLFRLVTKVFTLEPKGRGRPDGVSQYDDSTMEVAALAWEIIQDNPDMKHRTACQMAIDESEVVIRTPKDATGFKEIITYNADRDAAVRKLERALKPLLDQQARWPFPLPEIV